MEYLLLASYLMGEDGMEILVLLLGLAIVVGIFANSRGRSGWGWFFLSCIITPIVTGLLVVVLPNLKAVEIMQREISESKICPQCAERIKDAAIVCRFCGYRFESSAPNREMSNSPIGRIEPRLNDDWRRSKPQ
jgi:ribosomal protein L40E